MRLEPVIDVQNVGPGKTAIITLPLGPTYEALHLDLNGGLLNTDIDLITGKIDGKPFFVATGAELADQINYEGFGIGTDKLTLDFTLPKAKSMGGGKGPTSQAAEILLTCLPSAVMQSLTFEVKINAAANVASAIDATMQISDPTNNPFILKQLQADYAFAAANVNNVLLPTGQSGGMLEKIFMHKQGGLGSITKLELKNNGVTILDATPEMIQYIQTQFYGKVQKAGLVVIDFHLQGLRSKLFNTTVGNNVYMKITTDDAMQLRIYNRYIDPINRK